METAEIDKELAELEHKAEHLRALYEQYFMGIDRMEPLIPRRDVERRIIVLRREQLRNTAQRFKFNTLVQRFNTMQMYWARIVREIENGTYRRDVIRAAARFGEGALTVLGKKKSKGLTDAIARAQSKRKAEEPLDDGAAVGDARSKPQASPEPFELEADDLIEDNEDDAPTPPKLEAPRAVAPVQQSLAVGLGQGDLPVVGARTSVPAAAPAAAAPRPPGAVGALPPPAAPPPAAPLPAAPPPAAPPQRLAGLRWGGSPSAAPSAAPAGAARPTGPEAGRVQAPAGDVKKRVAELAAQLGTSRQSQPQGGFGELDLDFNDSPAPPVAAPKPVGLPAPVAPSRAVPRAAPPPAGAISGFGELDLPLDGELSRPASPPTSPVAPGPGLGAQPRPVQRPPVARGSTTSPADGELPDQRIRQIYAKYVETKRSTQESTAGVTFEKLAASLRAQATKLRSAHPNRAIDYEVVVKDGKTHLKPVLR